MTSVPVRIAGRTRQGVTGWAALLTQERYIGYILLGVAVCFNLIALRSEAISSVPPLNDEVLHIVAAQRAADTLAAGQNPTDPWLGAIVMGYPLSHYYQHLAYLSPALLSVALFKSVSMAALINWTTYLLLSLFPLSIYWSMRRLGFGYLPAACSALAAPLVATNGLFGFDYASYLWRGSGLYTQLWGMLLLPPAVAQGYYTLREGRGYFWTVLLLAATLLCHTVFGYMALLTLVLLAVVTAFRASETSEARLVARLGRSGLRLGLILGLVALVASYFLVPFALDGEYMNRSVWEMQSKYDSYGHDWVLRTLLHGDIFDYGRFPSLTILAAIGLGLCLYRWNGRDARYRVPVAISLLWLLLYFGRPTWGVLLNLLPMSRDLHFHRLIAGLHLGGILLIGLGLALPLGWALRQRELWPKVVAGALCLALLVPAVVERADYAATNARWIGQTEDDLRTERQQVANLMRTLHALPPGRVYAGTAAGWGKSYRVGSVPMYALLQRDGFDMHGYLYHALSLNADIQVLFDERRPEEYNLFNVRYVVAPADRGFPDFVTPVATFGRHRLYTVATSGYFDLVRSEIDLAGDKEEFYPAASRWLQGGEPAAKEFPEIMLGTPASEHPGSFALSQAGVLVANAFTPTAPPVGRVLAETAGSASYQARVEVEQPGMVLLKTTYHPNWRATIDGVAVKPVMLMPSYIGLPVQPGTHQVSLTYRTGSLRGIFSLVGLVTLGLIAIAERRRDGLTALGGRLAGRRWVGGVRNALDAAADRVANAAIWRSLAPHAPYLGLLLLAGLLAGLPLLQFKLLAGHDTLVYLPRNQEFYRNLSEGQYLPRWAPDLNFGFGEPHFLFTPPAIYYAVAVLHQLGFSLVAAESVLCLALLLAAGIGMYLLANAFFGPRGGLVSAVAYLFAPYVLVALYVRHALADFACLAVLPFAFWGLYRFVDSGRYRFLLAGAAATALLMLTSNTVALITFPMLGLLLLALAWSRRAWRPLLRGALLLAFGLGLSAFFWLPAIVERQYVQMDRLLQGPLNYHNHFLAISQLLHSPWGYGFSRLGTGDGMSFAIGPPHLLLAVVAAGLVATVLRPSRGVVVATGFFLAMTVAAAFLTLDLARPIWDALPLLQNLQFPWRYLSLIALSTAFLAGAPLLLVRAPGERLVANGLTAVLVLVFFFAGFPHARPQRLLDYTDSVYSPAEIAAKNYAATTALEYQPIWVREQPKGPVGERLAFVSGKGQVVSARTRGTHYTFQVSASEPSRLRVNTFYFPGWTLRVDGIRRPIEHTNRQGVMEFPLAQGVHQVELTFNSTPVRVWSGWLSLLALVALLAIPLAGLAGRQRWGPRLHRRRATATEPASAEAVSTSAGPIRRAAGLGSRRHSAARLVGVHDRLSPGRVLPDTTSAPPGPSTTPDRRLKLGLVLLLLSVYALTTSGHFRSSDEIAVYLTTQALVERHELAIKQVNDTVRGPDGKYYNTFGIGQSLISIPLYLVGKYVDAVASPAWRHYFGGPDIGDWGGAVPLFFVSLLNLFVAPLICLLVYLLCLRLDYSPGRALLTALALGLGTGLWVYATQYFQHPLESLFVLLTVYLLFAHKEHLTRRHAALAGGSLGLAILTRLNVVLLAPLIALYLLFISSTLRAGEIGSALRGFAPRGEPRSTGRHTDSDEDEVAVDARRGLAWRRIIGFQGAFLVPVAIALLGVMLVNQAKFGDVFTYNPHTAETGFGTPLWKGLYGNLFSPGRSLFLYSPPLILAVAGLGRFVRRHRAEALLVLSLTITYLVLYSTYGRWHGDWAWGPRLLLPVVPLLMLALPSMLEGRGGWALAVALTGAGIGIQILGTAVNYSYVYWGWRLLALTPPDAYLYVLDVSAIPTHWRYLLDGRYVDYWLLWVNREFGARALLFSLALPVTVLVLAVRLLRQGWLGATAPATRTSEAGGGLTVTRA